MTATTITFGEATPLDLWYVFLAGMMPLLGIVVQSRISGKRIARVDRKVDHNSRRVEEVHRQVKTSNGHTLGQVAEHAKDVAEQVSGSVEIGSAYIQGLDRKVDELGKTMSLHTRQIDALSRTFHDHIEKETEYQKTNLEDLISLATQIGELQRGGDHRSTDTPTTKSSPGSRRSRGPQGS